MATWWLNPDSTNLVEATVVNSLEALNFLLFRGPHALYSLTPLILSTLRVWGLVLNVSII